MHQQSEQTSRFSVNKTEAEVEVGELHRLDSQRLPAFRVMRRCFHHVLLSRKSLQYLTATSPSQLLELCHLDSTAWDPQQAHLERGESEMTTTQMTRGSNHQLARGHQVRRQSRRNRGCQNKEQAFCSFRCIATDLAWPDLTWGACKTV